MEGPRYRQFREIAYLCMIEFCEGCGGEGCETGADPANKRCPFHEEWESIYNDLDQLVARAGSEKKVTA